ncbi:hypothetical protein [Novosphingobium percolationis]|uniref:hypothetical protein n=1 Tax=Novosphingobium percolationis TaxID=2871811 RepID=UPI001CD3F9DD|nr:hypothetical protein [Novosphingobium percolationis]
MSGIGDEDSPGKKEGFDVRELDKLIRQIVDKVRGNYFLNGETARGIPGEVKKIIDNNVDRL